MLNVNWKKLLGHTSKAQADQQGQLAAIQAVQAVIEFDLEGHVLTANANFLHATGYRLEEIQGQHHRMFVDAATLHSSAYAQFWQRLGQGQHDAGRYRRVTKEGRELWLQASYNPIFDSHGKPFKVVKYATDITAQQLRDADAQGQLQAIVKVQAIIEFALDGTILHANELFLQAMGYALHEIVGKHHRIFVPAEEAQSASYQAFWHKLAHGQQDCGQYRRIGKHGRTVWIDASYNPILDASDQPFKVVKYATDITARYNAATTLRCAVEGLGDSVQRSTHACSLAQQASEVAEAGGHTVRDVIQTMENISHSSRKIEDIVGVVDSIAFQTNILALNAAVEAARAGEQGRGFAVVAGEVRSLAQNSAAAAKEIKQLIQASCQQVACGAEQVRKAGQTMQDIMGASKEVTSIIREVSEAAVRQSSQLHEVTQVLSHAQPQPAHAGPGARMASLTTPSLPAVPALAPAWRQAASGIALQA